MGDNDDSCAKKPKIDSDESHLHENLKNLKDFQDIEIINNNTARKTVCLKGNFAGKDGFGLVILEKTAFTDEDLTKDKYFVPENYLKKIFSNDIYGNYHFYPKVELNDIKATVIHPATEKHIVKYALQNVYLFNETPENYKKLTLPHIEKEQHSLQWLYNILEGKSEQDRIVLDDPHPEIGFTLLPDLKWDGKRETLYLLAIIKKHGIKSLRDLTNEHLPLLRNIYTKGCEIIEEKYGLNSSQLRIYLHYQPSFYHLHVHFTYLRHDPPGIFTEKAHILSNVVSNLELLSDYYQRVTLPFVVKESDSLYNIFINQESTIKNNE